MRWNLRDLAPGFAALVQELSRSPAIRYVNETVWIFAIVETAHLVFLAILGGAVLTLNLRLLGGALHGVSERDLERATRPWLLAGVVGAIVTGVAMGVATANTLLPNAAFFIKMIALLAAILFSLAVARSVRRGSDRAANPGPRVLAVVAFALWSSALLLFATTTGLGAGALLIALVGFVLFATLLRRYRGMYLGVLAVLIVGALIASAAYPDQGVALVLVAAALVLVALASVLELRHPARGRPAADRLAPFASTLAWVTVAAAGRWIGFS